LARIWSFKEVLQPLRPTWQDKARKAFFSEEKKQKTFIFFGHAVLIDTLLKNKSFLVLFFKKEHSSFL
jgi:hypothetical protein